MYYVFAPKKQIGVMLQHSVFCYVLKRQIKMHKDINSYKSDQSALSESIIQESKLQNRDHLACSIYSFTDRLDSGECCIWHSLCH